MVDEGQITQGLIVPLYCRCLDVIAFDTGLLIHQFKINKMKNYKFGLAVLLLSLTVMIGAMIFAPENRQHRCIDSTHLVCDGQCSCDGMECDFNDIGIGSIINECEDTLIGDETWYTDSKFSNESVNRSFIFTCNDIFREILINDDHLIIVDDYIDYSDSSRYTWFMIDSGMTYHDINI